MPEKTMTVCGDEMTEASAEFWTQDRICDANLAVAIGEHQADVEFAIQEMDDALDRAEHNRGAMYVALDALVAAVAAIKAATSAISSKR
jgi:hypothetical protein